MGEFKFKGKPRSIDDFSNPDNDSRGLWRKEALVSTISKKSYKIVDPKREIALKDTFVSIGKLVPNNSRDYFLDI